MFRQPEIGVLEEIDGDRLPEMARKGTQMVCCADSDQFPDIWKTHAGLCGCNRCAPLNHYGGALVIPDHSPASALGQSEHVREQLFLGHALGKGSVQVHISHYPCGIARGYNLSPVDCFRLLCDAPDTILNFFEKRLDTIGIYFDVVDMLERSGKEPNIESICFEGRLTRREVLAIQRVEKCSSREIMNSIRIPVREDLISQYHVDWRDKKRTYHLKRNRFKEWVRERGNHQYVTESVL